MARTQPNTQRGDVLNHLKTFGSITSWEAIKEYGVMSSSIVTSTDMARLSGPTDII